MPRLIARGHYFNRLAQDALSEAEFERLVFQEADDIFPGHFMVEFRKTVLSESGPNQADFALVHRDYKDWWVVEVELAGHPLDGHVVPQVLGLAHATYGPAEASYLADKDSRLDRERLQQMMRGAQPKTVVIVNAERDGWRSVLTAMGSYLIVVEVYRSTLDSHALLIHGGIPSISDQLVSRCVPQPGVGKAFLRVLSPAALLVPNGGSVEIQYEGSMSLWRRLDVSDSVWLYPESGDGLP